MSLCNQNYMQSHRKGTLHKLASLYLPFNTCCRRCYCGNAALLRSAVTTTATDTLQINSLPSSQPENMWERRENTHSNVNPGILSLSRWAFMVALRTFTLLCTWYIHVVCLPAPPCADKEPKPGSGAEKPAES